MSNSIQKPLGAEEVPKESSPEEKEVADQNGPSVFSNKLINRQCTQGRWFWNREFYIFWIL